MRSHRLPRLTQEKVHIGNHPILLAANENASTESMLVPLFRECTNELDVNWKQTGYPVIVIATTNNADHLPGSLFSVFKHEITFEVGAID